MSGIGTSLSSLSDEFYCAYEAACSFKLEVPKSLTIQCNAAQEFAVSTLQSAHQIGSNTLEKTKCFVLNNKETLFFIGCCATTAILAPKLFFPAAVAMIFLRLQINRSLSSLANEYLKDHHNPYIVSPLYGPNYISPLSLTMGTVAAAATLALASNHFAGNWPLAALPVLGGLAAGNATALLGMDLLHPCFFFAPQQYSNSWEPAAWAHNE